MQKLLVVIRNDISLWITALIKLHAFFDRLLNENSLRLFCDKNSRWHLGLHKNNLFLQNEQQSLHIDIQAIIENILHYVCELKVAQIRQSSKLQSSEDMRSRMNSAVFHMRKTMINMCTFKHIRVMNVSIIGLKQAECQTAIATILSKTLILNPYSPCRTYIKQEGWHTHTPTETMLSHPHITPTLCSLPVRTLLMWHKRSTVVSIKKSFILEWCEVT